MIKKKDFCEKHAPQARFLMKNIFLIKPNVFFD